MAACFNRLWRTPEYRLDLIQLLGSFKMCTQFWLRTSDCALRHGAYVRNSKFETVNSVRISSFSLSLKVEKFNQRFWPVETLPGANLSVRETPEHLRRTFTVKLNMIEGANCWVIFLNFGNQSVLKHCQVFQSIHLQMSREMKGGYLLRRAILSLTGAWKRVLSERSPQCFFRTGVSFFTKDSLVEIL